MTSRILTIALACLFVSCGRHYLVLNKVAIDGNSLASTFARSPDPRQENFPTGEEIYISWICPTAFSLNGYSIALHVIYRDLSEEEITYPVRSPIGIEKFQLVGDKYRRTRGFFTYKAVLLDGEGRTIDIWQHAMWVKVVH